MVRSAEVHLGESFLVLVNRTPGSVVFLLLLFLRGLIRCWNRCRLLHRSRHVERLARVVGLAGSFALVSAGHDCKHLSLSHVVS